MATFWTTDYSDSGVTNPKRNFRFRVTIGAFTDTDLNTSVVFWAKTADKPSFTLGEATHNYLNHTFKFPGRVTWNDVTIAMVDPGGEKGVAYGLTKILNNSGYVVPTTEGEFQTISKTKAVSGLGSILVEQMNDVGNTQEAWTLNNAFISEVKYGSLDYGSEDLTEYTLTIKYDWATYNEDANGEIKFTSLTS